MTVTDTGTWTCPMCLDQTQWISFGESFICQDCGGEYLWTPTFKGEVLLTVKRP